MELASSGDISDYHSSTSSEADYEEEDEDDAETRVLLNETRELSSRVMRMSKQLHSLRNLNQYCTQEALTPATPEQEDDLDRVDG